MELKRNFIGVENDFKGVLLKREIPYHDRFFFVG